ncbi:hypothetical protein BH23GEM6_BH23GEM6_26650 [soil metagenome]
MRRAGGERARRSTDRTRTDASGRRWGASPGKIHLGGVTLPAPTLTPPPGQRDEIHTTRTAVIGYSLGSYLAGLLAAEDRNVRALVIAAGGDLAEGMPLSTVARSVTDPLRAVKKLNGRPLLVVHGKHDRTVRPVQAQRLFDAALEPKELRWWDAGHYLPETAIHDAAAWLTRHLA